MQINPEPMLQLADLTLVGLTPLNPAKQRGTDLIAAGLGLGLAVYRSPAGRCYTCQADSRGYAMGCERIGPDQVWRDVQAPADSVFQGINYGEPIVMTLCLGRGQTNHIGTWFLIAEIICEDAQAPLLAALAHSHPAVARELAHFVTHTAIGYMKNDPIHQFFDREKFADGIARLHQLLKNLPR